MVVVVPHYLLFVLGGNGYRSLGIRRYCYRGDDHGEIPHRHSLCFWSGDVTGRVAFWVGGNEKRTKYKRRYLPYVHDKHSVLILLLGKA